MKKLMQAVVAALAAGVLSMSSLAAEKIWKGGASGDWSLDANWVGGVPTANDCAVFTDNGATLVEIAGTNKVGQVNVGAGTVTLRGVGDAACLFFTGIDGASATSFKAEIDATVVMEVPVYSEIRCEKGGQGTGIFRSSIVLNPPNSSLVSWYGGGSNVFERGSSLTAPYCYFGVGQQAAGVTSCLILKDDARIDIAGEADFSGSDAFDKFALVIDGDEAQFNVGGTFYLNRYATVPQADSDIRLVLNRGTLTVGGSLCTSTAANNTQGKFIQNGGVANLYRLVCHPGGAVTLAGGVTAFSSSDHSFPAGTELELAGGTLSHDQLQSFVHVTADSAVRVPAAATWAFEETAAKIDAGVALVKKGAGAVTLAGGAALPGSLTVAEGAASVADGAQVVPVGDWKLTVEDGATFTVGSGAAFLSPFALAVNGTGVFATAAPVTVSSYTIDGLAQARGSHADGMIVLPCLWTGAGDGFTWSDAANWSEGVAPVSSGASVVDLSAAETAIVIDDDIQVGRLVFAPLRSKTVKLTGCGSIDFATESNSSTAIHVQRGSKVEFDVDVKKSVVPNVVIDGMGTVEFKKAIPSSTLAASAFSVSGTVILSGKIDVDVLAFSMRGHNYSCVKIVDGADITAKTVFFSPSVDGYDYMIDQVIQTGGIVRAGEFSICNVSPSTNDRTDYRQEGGELVISGLMLSGNLPAAATDELKAKRSLYGSYEIVGGKLTLGGVSTFENNNYVKFHGGEVYLKGDIYADTAGGSAVYSRDAYPVLFGGSTIYLSHTTESGTITTRCQLMFSGVGGETVMRKAPDCPVTRVDFNIGSTTSGSGGFAFEAMDCCLSFNGWIAHSGRLTINNNFWSYIGEQLAGPREYVIKSGSVRISSEIYTQPESITVQETGSGLGGTFWTERKDASYLQVKHYVVGGVEKPAGSYDIDVNNANTTLVVTQDAPASWLTGDVADLSYSGEGEVKSLAERAEVSSLAFTPARTIVENVSISGDAALVFKDGATIDVSEGRTVTFDVPVELGGKVVKKGLGKVVFNKSVTSTYQGDIDPYGTTDLYWLTVTQGTADFDGEVTRVRLITAGLRETEVPVITLKKNCTVSYYASVFTAYTTGSLAVYGETRQDGATVDFRDTSYFGYDGVDWVTPLSSPNGGKGRYVMNSGAYYFYGSTATVPMRGWTNGTYEFVQNGGEVAFDHWSIESKGTTPLQRFSWTLNGGRLTITYPWNGANPDDSQVFLNGGTLVLADTHGLGVYDPFPAGQFEVTLGGALKIEPAASFVAVLGNRAGGSGSIELDGAGAVRIEMPQPVKRYAVRDGNLLAFTQAAAAGIDPEAELAIYGVSLVYPMFSGLCTFKYVTLDDKDVRKGVYYSTSKTLGRVIYGEKGGGVQVLARAYRPGLLIMVR